MKFKVITVVLCVLATGMVIGYDFYSSHRSNAQSTIDITPEEEYAEPAEVTKKHTMQHAALNEEAPNNSLESELNTAYYTQGNYRELKKGGIIDKKGDVMGIGGAKVLNADLENANFTKIDIRETKVIPVNARKAKLVTGHEEGSYEFVKNGDMIASLNILDPDEFWKSSKYLVLETK